MPLGQNAKVNLSILGIILLFCATALYSAGELYPTYREKLKLPSLSLPSWVTTPFRLGLDLKGGTHLLYETDLSRIPAGDRASAVEGVRDVIERRVNAFGVSEPIVQTVKAGDSYRVIVELAGVHDVNEAIKLIGDTPLLEFKEEDPDAAKKPQELNPEQQKELDTFNASAGQKAKDIQSRLAKGEDFASLAKEVSEDLASKDKGGDLGWIRSGTPNEFLVFPVSKLKPGETTKDLFTGPEGHEILKLVAIRETEKEIAARHILICYEGATRCEQKISKDDARKKIEELKGRATAQNFEQLAKENSTEAGASTRGGDLGFFGKGAMVKSFEDAAFPLAKGGISDIVETEFGFHVIYKYDERPLKEYQVSRILVKTKKKEDFLPPPNPWKDTGLTGKQLKRAYVQFGQTSLPEVGIEFNDEGKKLFGDLTKRSVGKPIAIFLDKQVISAPRVQTEILDGTAIITGDFTVDEAKTLAQRLNTGALPVPISLASQQTIGATLGQESLQKSLAAGLFGFLLVVLFMIGFYRLPGLLAVCALLVYTALTLAIFKMGSVTLSLAGIAGFILSIGMAVDANILIFERMKEELRWGRGLEGSLVNGFKRAWTSIRDSNVSSLITCVILFWFSASLIKGFALTLALGILVSMFTAIMITRTFLRRVVTTGLSKNLWLFSGKKQLPADQKS